MMTNAKINVDWYFSFLLKNSNNAYIISISINEYYNLVSVRKYFLKWMSKYKNSKIHKRKVDANNVNKRG